MSTDRNEALRLADSIHEMNNAAYMTAIANLNEKNRQQAERIAELQSAHAIAIEIGAQYAAERDHLRAEVERLRAPLSEEQIWFLTNDGMRNAAGGIYESSVIAFARAVERAHVVQAKGPA